MNTSHTVAAKAPDQQGRAPGLYDEQLQRQQQEKALFCTEAMREPAHLYLASPTSVSVMRRVRRALHLG